MCVVFVRNVTDYLPLEFSYYPTEAVSNKLDPAMVDHVSEAISSPTLIIKKDRGSYTISWIENDHENTVILLFPARNGSWAR